MLPLSIIVLAPLAGDRGSGNVSILSTRLADPRGAVLADQTHRTLWWAGTGWALKEWPPSAPTSASRSMQPQTFPYHDEALRRAGIPPEDVCDEAMSGGDRDCFEPPAMGDAGAAALNTVSATAACAPAAVLSRPNASRSVRVAQFRCALLRHVSVISSRRTSSARSPPLGPHRDAGSRTCQARSHHRGSRRRYSRASANGANGSWRST